jgi:hypothetical protein
VDERSKLGLLMVAGFIGTIFDASPVFASTAESFLTIERANVLTVMEFLWTKEILS